MGVTRSNYVLEQPRLSYLTVHKFRTGVDTRRGTGSFGIVVCRSVGTLPAIVGLLRPNFKPNSGSKSKISGRILKKMVGALLAHPSSASGRMSDFRTGFWLDCYREHLEIGPPAGRRPAGGPISVFPR